MNYNTKKLREMRVVVAKDALAWIEEGAIIPAGTYVNTRDFTKWPAGDAQSDALELRDYVLGQCEACAVGALFLAHVVRNDDCKVSEFRKGLNDPGDRPYFLYGKLSKVFSRQQLALIETAFEQTTYPHVRAELHIEQITRCMNFAIGDRVNRLRQILANIIAHNGEFVP